MFNQIGDGRLFVARWRRKGVLGECLGYFTANDVILLSNDLAGKGDALRAVLLHMRAIGSMHRIIGDRSM